MSVKEAISIENKTVKQLARELIDRLPDDVDWPRLEYHLGVVKAVYESLHDRGPGIPHEEAMRRPRPWK